MIKEIQQNKESETESIDNNDYGIVKDAIIGNNIKVLVDNKIKEYQEEQKILEDENKNKENELILAKSENHLTYSKGAVMVNDHRKTYYAQDVLPGGGLDILGRHVAEDGTIRDENDYIVVSADWNFLPYGTIDIYIDNATFIANDPEFYVMMENVINNNQEFIINYSKSI